MSAISVENLGKRYTISHQAHHDTLRDALTGGLRGLWRRMRQGAMEREDFWALRDLNFTVEPGEIVGIIGRNGAGKSTLLKVLSRITEPTSGRINIKGRVASLLEVGTGFHPELSGRENIFLNGAILGMSRVEIRRKFDEIVAFAEVEKFLDTPVKRYSSGMYVRLAFSVAAHLEPEILIVDEVLAVGDIAFQKKCIGKMEDVAAGHGRTILFVSHNLATLRQLCKTGILLKGGQLVHQGTMAETLGKYSSESSPANEFRLPTPSAESSERAFLTAVTIETQKGEVKSHYKIGEPWQIRAIMTVVSPLTAFVFGIGLKTSEGLGLQTAWTSPRALQPGRYQISFVQDKVALAAGSYQVAVGLSETDVTFNQSTIGRLDISGENPLQYCAATSGFGHILNSMETEITPLGEGQ